MFENISFLFLFAMALLSWAVLCLQHAVEIQRRAASHFRVELYKERPEITFEPHVYHKPLDRSPLGNAFDFAKSFWVILALTFGLSKLLQLVERRAKNYLRSLETLKPASAVEFGSLMENPAAEQKLTPFQQNPETLDPLVVEENTDLRERLRVLEAHCVEVSELLQELRLSKSCSSQESVQSGDEGVVTEDHSEESVLVVRKSSTMAESVSSSTQCSRNIYITNSHIHIEGPVFCSDHNLSMELSRQASMYPRKQSEFLQVWGKYITGPKERPMIAGSMRCNNILL